MMSESDVEIYLYQQWIKYLNTGQIDEMTFKEFIEDFVSKANHLKMRVRI